MPSSKKLAFKGLKVLITSGPTSVPIDDMRVITNRSTGEMGRLLANGFINAGATVTLLEGAVTTSVKLQKLANVKKFYFYDDLAFLLKKELNNKYHIVIHAAAVSDFSLKTTYKGKLPSNNQIRLALQPTVKLINTIKKDSPKSFLIGFKFETCIEQKPALDQIKSLLFDASCDMVILNENNLNGYKAILIGADKKMSQILHSKKMLVQLLVRTLSL